eukprot:CAMPEP_0174287254 /NCGR_PEP_ID=MMETSP0809-20121228/15083_1 /TAXON_ID=73025 ORGANISM="Eutreptiella gymnastica-like, Strain CCMP1594" /NCGR_SAMPLE_ID=MMETSP0809 /ASSEMBLY_ACC=CAM_ASM_000658 /LENGTH=126 /DNA_ID=CAMNT_0015383717 /DNA_START=117 /DNA_END=497 /DNA_ORIENTATION=+
MTMWQAPSKLHITPREEGTVKDIFLSAIEGDNDSIVHCLENGVELNEIGLPSNGWGPFAKLPGFQGTPLHFAVGYGNIDTVRLLLERGARTDVKTRSGFYPYEYAQQRGYTEILQLLQMYEKNNEV